MQKSSSHLRPQMGATLSNSTPRWINLRSHRNGMPRRFSPAHNPEPCNGHQRSIHHGLLPHDSEKPMIFPPPSPEPGHAPHTHGQRAPTRYNFARVLHGRTWTITVHVRGSMPAARHHSDARESDLAPLLFRL